MMPGKQTDFGYDYTISLCSAIEKYTEQKEAESPSLFIYKGVNLKYALERALYISLGNNRRFLEWFIEKQFGRLAPEKIYACDTLDQSILALLLNVSPSAITIRQKKRCRRFIRLCVNAILRGLAFRFCLSLLRAFMNRVFQRTARPEVLLYVESVRFVRYLEPIARKLSSYAFITNDRDAAQYARTAGLPCIRLFSLGPRIEHLAQEEGPFERFLITDKYDRLADSLEWMQPKTIVMVEGNAAHDEIANRIAHKLGITSICIQQGWSPIVHSGFRNMSYSKMLVWGDGFAELLAPYNPHQRFVVTGNHSLSLKPRPAGRDSIAFFLQ